MNNYEQENFGLKEDIRVPKRKFSFKMPNFKNPKNIISALVVAVLVVIILIIVFYPNEKNTSSKDGLTISLLEDEVMEIEYNKDYVDPGYIAYDDVEGDLTNEVKIYGYVDIKTSGEYSITYEVTNKDGTTVEVTRKIIVKEPYVPENTDLGYKENNERTLLLSLIGKETITIKKGSKYTEKGYMAYDSIDGDVSNYVKVKSSIDPDKLGMQTIKYSITYGGITKSIERKVIVVNESKTMGLNVTLDVSEENPVNTSVTIKINIEGNNYKYTLLPNNAKVYKNTINYVTSTNGNYEFIVFDMDNNSKSYSINVSNIDRVKPFATCSGKVTNGKTYLSIEAKDEDSGIAYYQYGLTEFNKNMYEINKPVPSARIEVYDKAGNNVSVSCPIEGYAPFNPVELGTNMNSSEYIPCGINWSSHNRELANRVKAAGQRTRKGVVAAAVYLSTYFEYKIPYFYAGGHYHYSWDKGDKFIGISSKWGCPTKIATSGIASQPEGSEQLAGMDCTGFVAWAFINAGWTQGEIGSFSGGTDQPDKIYWNGIKAEIIDFQSSKGSIQAGDVVWQPGHMGLVINVNDDTVTIAEEILQGLTVKEHSIRKGSSFEKVLLLDKFYSKG